MGVTSGVSECVSERIIDGEKVKEVVSDLFDNTSLIVRDLGKETVLVFSAADRDTDVSRIVSD